MADDPYDPRSATPRSRRSLEPHRLAPGHKAIRALWNLTWLLLYRPSPVILHGWRRSLLRLFGATVAPDAHPYPSARIWAPWNLSMSEESCLGPRSECYCVAPVRLGARATVSQGGYLCTASHDHTDPSMPLVVAPIRIGDDAWLTASVFVGPGVTIGTGAVVGAGAVVMHDVAAWTVVACPAPVVIGMRPPIQRPDRRGADARDDTRS